MDKQNKSRQINFRIEEVDYKYLKKNKLLTADFLRRQIKKLILLNKETNEATRHLRSK